MRSQHYILRDDGSVENVDLMTWAVWFENAKRHLGDDTLPSGVRVSTVFLGLDHNFDEGPPLLFETMIFGGSHDMYMERYSSKDEALAGHQKALELAREP